MILLIDNYDGCVNNIFQLIGVINPDIKIVRNDRITVDNIINISPSHIVISGGSMSAEKTNVAKDIVRQLGGKIPLLGICLGYRVICGAFGAPESAMKVVMQGKVSNIILEGSCPLFNGLPSEIKGVRYHSTTVIERDIPPVFRIIARASDGDIMGVQHNDVHIYGLQFHPESFLSEYGSQIINNFLNL